jgi:squalene/oxidosqualene cyclase-like protein
LKAGETIPNLLTGAATPGTKDRVVIARSDGHGARVGPAIDRALDNLGRLQDTDGSWPGDYGGPMFLLPMYLALCHAAGRLPTDRSAGMIRHLLGAQHTDGSLGLHAEDARGSMFTTALAYVGLRILGLPAKGEPTARMRRWIVDHGSPLGAASWGKLTLCLLGLYDWRGIHPVPPELWLLPAEAPMHPRRLWCHCRQVYLPMAWLYGNRSTIPQDALVRALRQELYDGSFDRIEWGRQRDTISEGEAYRQPTTALRATNGALDVMDRLSPRSIRRRALDVVLDHILYEDRVTGFIDIGPVNKVLNTFVHHFREPGGASFEQAFAACDLYLWDGRDGTKMQGYNSSRLWDTAFATQAILAVGGEARGSADPLPILRKAYDYLCDNQVIEDVPDADRYYRHPSRGGWPFSNRAHGWPITDCTAEGLRCALALEGRFGRSIPVDLLRDAVRLILSWQNEDGGWATYERKRGGDWLEALNPSQVFGDIMVDYSYIECTGACLQALAAARRRFGSELAEPIDVAMARGARFLRENQRSDGSFEGSWAVCFTYGTWFGVSGLLAAGAPPGDLAIQRACQFLLEKQRSDGGWGEHGDSCRERRYVDSPQGTVVQTSWALSTLARARHRSAELQARAVDFLLARQEPDGSWKPEPLVGVFNRTCLINYDNYRHYFPVLAIGEWMAAGAAVSS